MSTSLFDTVFNWTLRERFSADDQSVSDTFTTRQGYTDIDVDLPGCTASSIRVRVMPGKLAIEAHRTDVELKKLMYQLTDQVDLDKVTAIYKHGVLRVRLPTKDLPLEASRVVPVTAG